MTTSKLPDQWATRDLPILRRVAELLEVDKQRTVQWQRVSVDLRIESDDTRRSMVALHDSDYIEAVNADTYGGGQDRIATALTERGRRAVGLWPSGDSVDALVDALRQAEDATDDPEEKGALRKAAGAVLGVGRDVMTDVMGAVIAKSITG